MIIPYTHSPSYHIFIFNSFPPFPLPLFTPSLPYPHFLPLSFLYPIPSSLLPSLLPSLPPSLLPLSHPLFTPSVFSLPPSSCPHSNLPSSPCLSISHTHRDCVCQALEEDQGPALHPQAQGGSGCGQKVSQLKLLTYVHIHTYMCTSALWPQLKSEL